MMRAVSIATVAAIGALTIGLTGLVTPANAQDPATRSKKASFEDVKEDLTNAIVKRGLTIDSTGNVGRMLDRTGADVGSAKPIYKAAEYMAFCSAKLSRAMMEADPANMVGCPYVVYLYETATKPGLVVVGYKPLAPRGNAASKKSLEAVNALLAGIIADAVK